MSEHEIEKIARMLDPGAYALLDSHEDKAFFRRMYSHMFDAHEAKARAILPLLASAREEGRLEGAKEIERLAEEFDRLEARFTKLLDSAWAEGAKGMQERAAKEAEYYARHSTTAKNITREIRALSLEGSKT